MTAWSTTGRFWKMILEIAFLLVLVIAVLSTAAALIYREKYHEAKRASAKGNRRRDW